MNQRETVAEYTRGVMDSIRDYCGIEKLEPIRQDKFTWRYVLPTGEFVFEIIPHDLLSVRHCGKTEIIDWVRNEKHAQKLIDDYLRGIL